MTSWSGVNSLPSLTDEPHRPCVYTAKTAASQVPVFGSVDCRTGTFTLEDGMSNLI